MTSLRFAVALVAAVIVHVAVVLAWPILWPKTTWQKLSAQMRPMTFEPYRPDVPSVGAGIMNDPFFSEFVCRFNLAQTPVRLTDPVDLPFWTVSIRDPAGTTLYSGTSGYPARSFDVVAADPQSISDFGSTLAANIPSAGIAEVRMDEGFAIVRAFIPDKTWSKVAEQFAASLRCDPYRPAD